MTLRSRLVLALLALSTVGLAVFGVTTYTLYYRSQLQQLDDQLRSNALPLSGRLQEARYLSLNAGSCTSSSTTPATTTTPPSGEGPFTNGNPPARGNRGFGPGQGLDAYAELRDAEGAALSCVEPLDTTSRPDIPADVAVPDSGSRVFTTGSATGSGDWRVLVTGIQVRGTSADVDDPTLSPPATLVLAVRTSGIDESMRRLVQIEVAAALGLLTALGIGAWLILRHGLRPLEQMATSAATITTGDLTERVTPADDRTEVGQLGLALNTMLDGIEDSFREREATERRLRQFLSDASHELRTPLTSIQGFAELFRLGADDDRVNLPVILRRIEQEAGRMKVLVEDLLLLARLDETRPAASDPVDLTVLAADACTDAVATAPDRQVTLDAPSPVVVQGDADHLRQAIANLVTNAVKHTPDGTPIEVSTRISGATASVTVRDHGPGLGADAVAHVFDRFWQADAARVGTGNGLGLAIVAGIAEEHGGTASVANLVDGGAAFTVEIPVGGPTSVLR